MSMTGSMKDWPGPELTKAVSCARPRLGDVTRNVRAQRSCSTSRRALASVTVIARDADESFEVDEATERMLLEAIAQCDSGRTVALDKVLSDLRHDH